jgi:hypothetical protein
MKNCKNCKKEIPNRNSYCNNFCQQEYFYKEYIKRWKKGLEDGIMAPNTAQSTSYYLRKYLFEKYKNKCCKCGWGELNEYTEKIPLQIEHKDGNWMNNKESNLLLLCPNCHSLTKTYGALNKGNGRTNRHKLN